MAKPATKIWCPKCHKRHRLPPNAGGLTLRCRGCKFAFRVQDGLTQDPGGFVELSVEDVAASASEPMELAAVPAEPAHYASTEVLPMEDSSSAVIPVKKEPVGKSAATPKPEPAGFDDDFGDILEVLDQTAPPEPIDADLIVDDPGDAAPRRAHAKRTKQAEPSTAVVPSRRNEVVSDSANQETVRQPVTRQQLRSHRNSRQFWMMMSLAFACLLGFVSWVSLNMFMKPELSTWERKMLYAMGAPARWLPPHEGEGDPLLPPNHVKLRGDHGELADRNDFFRDNFVNEARRTEPFDNDREADVAAGDDREGDRRGAAFPNRGKGGVGLGGENEGQQAMRLNRGDANRVARNNRANTVPPGANRNNAARNNNPNFARNNPNGRARNKWQPPALSAADIQMVATRGFDPKTKQTISINTDRKIDVALVGENVFSMAEGNRLSVFDIESNSELHSRKLDRKVAVICAAKKNRINLRPAAWVLFDSGQLEKWELSNGELSRVVSVALKPVFNERHACIASGKQSVAYNVDGEIIVARVLEAAAKVSVVASVPTSGQVFAMRFSKDDSQLLAIVDQRAVLIDAVSGEVLSQKQLPRISDKAIRPEELSISEDLSTLFIAQNGVIDSVRVEDGVGTGQYWSSIPLPIEAVVSGNDSVLGLTRGTPSQGTLFTMTTMVAVNAEVSKRNEVSTDGGEQRELLQGDAGQDGADSSPHEKSRSPVLGASIKAIQSLSDDKIAFLTAEGQRNRIGIATWKNGWSVKSLKLDPGFVISGFHMSDDLSRVAIFSNESVQAWEIMDVESGATRFVSESVAHTEKVTTILLTNDGQRIVSGDWSGVVHVSNFETGKKTGGVSGFRTAIVDIAARGDESFVVMDQRGIAGGSGNSNRNKITPFGTTVSKASTLSENGIRIAWFVESGTVDIKVVKAQGNHKVVGEFKPKNRPDIVRFMKDQEFLLLQNAKEVSVWDWRKGERLRVFRYGGQQAKASVPMGVSENGETIAVVTGNKMNQISVFELPSSEE